MVGMVFRLGDFLTYYYSRNPLGTLPLAFLFFLGGEPPQPIQLSQDHKLPLGVGLGRAEAWVELKPSGRAARAPGFAWDFVGNPAPHELI